MFVRIDGRKVLVNISDFDTNTMSEIFENSTFEGGEGVVDPPPPHDIALDAPKPVLKR